MSKLPKSNITKEERETLHNLKKDSNCIVLTTDKGVLLVIMNKDTYKEKYKTLLSGKQGIPGEHRNMYDPFQWPQGIPGEQGPYQIHPH